MTTNNTKKMTREAQLTI